MNRSLAILLSCYCAYLLGGCGSSQPVLFTPPSELDRFANTIADSVGKDAVAKDIAQRTKLKLEEINFAELKNKQQLLCAAIAHYTNPKKNTALSAATPLIILGQAMNEEGYTVLSTMPPTLQNQLRAYVATLIPPLLPPKKQKKKKKTDKSIQSIKNPSLQLSFFVL